MYKLQCYYVKLKSYTVSNIIKFQFEVLIEKRLNSISYLLPFLVS